MAINLPRNEDGTLVEYAWPGGYTVVYYTADGGTLCAECARMAEAEKLSTPDDAEWHIIAAELAEVANDGRDDDFPVACDHCNKPIE